MSQPKGYLVPIGGAEDKGEEQQKNNGNGNGLKFLENGILKNVVDLMKGREKIIEVITTATSRPEESFKNYKKAFVKLGCHHVGHIDIRSRSDINNEEITERIKKCNGVMFTGGDQSRLSAILGGSVLCKTLKERYWSDHFVIAGTSAGAAAMSAIMMNRGEAESANFKGEVDLSIGFGFINDVIFDTHFDARGRFIRLAQAIATQPGVLGIGLGEDSGVIVEKGSRLKAIGSSGVVIIDGTEIKYNNIAEVKEGEPFSAGKLGVYLMTHSDVFDLSTRAFMPMAFAEHQH